MKVVVVILPRDGEVSWHATPKLRGGVITESVVEYVHAQTRSRTGQIT